MSQTLLTAAMLPGSGGRTSAVPFERSTPPTEIGSAENKFTPARYQPDCRHPSNRMGAHIRANGGHSRACPSLARLAQRRTDCDPINPAPPAGSRPSRGRATALSGRGFRQIAERFPPFRRSVGLQSGAQVRASPVWRPKQLSCRRHMGPRSSLSRLSRGISRPVGDLTTPPVSARLLFFKERRVQMAAGIIEGKVALAFARNDEIKSFELE